MEALVRKTMSSPDRKKMEEKNEATKKYNKQERVVQKMFQKLPQYHDDHRQIIMAFFQLEKEYHKSALQAIDLSLEAIHQMKD